MSEISHLKNSPWDKTIKNKGKNELIDFLLALNSDSTIDKEFVSENLRELQEFNKQYNIEAI